MTQFHSENYHSCLITNVVRKQKTLYLLNHCDCLKLVLKVVLGFRLELGLWRVGVKIRVLVGNSNGQIGVRVRVGVGLGSLRFGLVNWAIGEKIRFGV